MHGAPDAGSTLNDRLFGLCCLTHLDLLDKVSVSHFGVDPDGQQLAVSLVELFRQLAEHAEFCARHRVVISRISGNVVGLRSSTLFNAIL